MNSVSLIGRLARDPDIRQTQSGLSVCSFTVAVDRRYREADGERKADFIPCVAWRQTADFVAQHFTKGKRIGLNGSLQIRTYEAQDGSKRTIAEVIVDNCEFVDSLQASTREHTAPAIEAPAPEDDDLPF